MFKIFFITLFCFQTLLFSLEVIGNFETISLDEFNVSHLQAKIDTGAVYSSLHCSNIKKIDDETVEFSIFDLNKTIKKKIEKTVMIKSSNGLQEQRFIISTMIILNQQTYPILFTLANRETMNHKVLIGTNFLKNRFLIDVSKKQKAEPSYCRDN